MDGITIFFLVPLTQTPLFCFLELFEFPLSEDIFSTTYQIISHHDITITVLGAPL